MCVLLCLWACTTVCVLVPLSVCACHCAHVLLSASPLALPPPTAAGPAGNSPHAPSLLSFIIICHEREPRRTVINKGHLKYETTTLTLGNISSVEQLVPPLSLWKGVPGAAAPARLPQAPSSLLPPQPLPSQLWSWRVWEGLGGLRRGVEGTYPRPVPSSQEALSLPLLDALWKTGCQVRRGGEYATSILWGSPSNSLSFLNSSEGTIEGLHRADTRGEAHVNTYPVT